MAIVSQFLFQEPYPLFICGADHGLTVTSFHPKPGTITNGISELFQPVFGIASVGNSS